MNLTLLTISSAAVFINIFFMCLNLHRGKGEPHGLRKYQYFFSKLFLLPSIALVWLQTTSDRNNKIILYMLSAWLGDVLLLVPEILFTMIGGIFFAMSHIFMLWFFNISWSHIPTVILLLILPGSLFIFILFIPKLFTRKSMSLGEIGVIVYLMVLFLSYCSAAARVGTYPINHPSFLLCYTGYSLFLVSDFFLLLNEFNISENPRRVEVMLTYSIAQVLIIFGTVAI